MSSSNLWLGVAGWQSPEWLDLRNGCSPLRKPLLSVLSEFADCAEIDSTRDIPLKPEIAQLWIRKVQANPRFVFNPVLGRQFTHDRDLRDAGVVNWCTGIAPFQEAGRLGCVVMEFPWAFRFTVENRAHLIELRRTFHRFPLVAEFRHESWLREEALGTLIDYRIGFVNLDQPAYFRGMPPSAAVTSSPGYVRLHGRNGVDWFREYAPTSAREPYSYSPQELQEWVQRVQKMSRHSARLFVTATESAAMLGLLHCLRLRGMLEDDFRQAPPEMLRRYWSELSGFSAAKPVQGVLIGPVQAVA